MRKLCFSVESLKLSTDGLKVKNHECQAIYGAVNLLETG